MYRCQGKHETADGSDEGEEADNVPVQIRHSIISIILAEMPLVDWPTSPLSPMFSFRQPQIDRQYVQFLIPVADDLPPIVVHQATCTIIDGVQRWAAFRNLGRGRIRARAFRVPATMPSFWRFSSTAGVVGPFRGLSCGASSPW